MRTSTLDGTIVLVLAAVVAGCSSAERPPPAGDTTARTADGLGRDPTLFSDEEMVEARAAQDVCRPLYSRPCQIFFIDVDGIKNCPWLHEVCRADGKGFHPCGEYPPGFEPPPAEDTTD